MKKTTLVACSLSSQTRATATATAFVCGLAAWGLPEVAYAWVYIANSATQTRLYFDDQVGRPRFGNDVKRPSQFFAIGAVLTPDSIPGLWKVHASFTSMKWPYVNKWNLYHVCSFPWPKVDVSVDQFINNEGDSWNIAIGGVQPSWLSWRWELAYAGHAPGLGDTFVIKSAKDPTRCWRQEGEELGIGFVKTLGSKGCHTFYFQDAAEASNNSACSMYSEGEVKKAPGTKPAIKVASITPQVLGKEVRVADLAEMAKKAMVGRPPPPKIEQKPTNPGKPESKPEPKKPVPPAAPKPSGPDGKVPPPPGGRPKPGAGAPSK